MAITSPCQTILVVFQMVYRHVQKGHTHQDQYNGASNHLLLVEPSFHGYSATVQLKFSAYR